MPWNGTWKVFYNRSQEVRKMISKEFLEALDIWQSSPGRKKVSIEMGDSADKNYFKVWVFDFDVMEGAHIKEPSDLDNLDLKLKKKQDLQKQLAELEELEEK
jgi:hypothetical protein